MSKVNAIAGVVLAVLVAGCLGLIGGYFYGSHRQGLIDDGKMAKANEAAATALASETERRREAETAGQRAFAAMNAANQQEKDNAKKQMDVLRGQLRTGAVRLSVAVDAASAARAAATATAGDREARADLLPAAAERILDFAGEGGDIVRDLNSCVDKYHEAERILRLAQ